jgi:GNAT superfamily N-acetyltransferase
VVGAAIWHGVDDWRLPLREVLRSSTAMIRGFGRNIPRALGALSRIEKVHPRDPHWYLAHVGVQPEHQGRGIGGVLVEAGTARADAEGVAAYLENSKPRNTPFYGRHGFAAGDTITIGDEAPPVLAMRRAPR